MRHFSLSAAMLLASTTALAALSQADIERIKAGAATTAAIARNQSTIGADGSIARGADGKPVAAPANSGNSTNQLGYVKRMFGVQDVSAGSNPALGAGAAGGFASGQQSVDFQCGRDEGARKVAGGVAIVLDSCYGTSMAAIQALKLSFCTGSLSGTVCTPDRFTQPSVVRVGAYTDVAEKLSAGVACNSAGVCRVTVRTSFSVQADGNSLKSQAQASSANSSTIANGLRSSADAIAQSDKYETIGRSMSDCVQAIDDATAGRSGLTTCAKDKAVALPVATQAGQQCEKKWVCDQEATQTATFTRACDRTFPVTGYSCTWSVPTFQCTATQSGSAEPTWSCTDGMTTADGELVNRSDKVCADPPAAPPAAPPTAPPADPSSPGNCTTFTWTEYYTVPSKMTQVGECQSQPLAVQGSPATACALEGKGIFAYCDADGWFRRTLSDAECTSSSVDDSGAPVLLSLTEREKSGCGACIKPITEDTCKGVPSANEPSDSCSLIARDPSCNTTPSEITAESTLPSTLPGGFVLSQKEEYTCQVNQTSCVSRHEVSNCPVTDLTKGLDTMSQEVPSNQAVMNEALAGAATIDAIGQATEECRDAQRSGAPCASTADLRIFNGKDMRCHKPVGFFSGVLENDCCRITLERPGGDRPFNKCSLSESELASARRGNLTQFVGEYCSKWVGLGRFKRCTQRTQTYCSFPGILAKVIQQQGRDQLAKAVTSGISAPEHATLSYDFYAGAGKWTPAVAAGGVLVAAWQTPSVCATAGGDASCPGALTQWFAACDNEHGGCSDLPLTPEAGSDTWRISAVDPLSTVAHGISSRAAVNGACDTAAAHCIYDVAVAPIGAGGRVTVQRSLSFPVSLKAADSNVYPVFLGTTVVRPVVEATASEAPRTLSISTNGGTSWTPVTVPFQISGSVPLPGTDATISGGCSTLSNVCQYTLSGSVQVSAKPWGPPQAPDCSGFTPDQLSALDFSRMDFSEWIASVMGKLSVPDTSKLVGQAAMESQRYFSVYQSGGTPAQQAPHPNAANTAIVSPRQGWAPFKANLVVSANYPENHDDPALNTDPVFGVTVDWGDCTSPVQASVVDEMINGRRASGFAAEHVYLPPDQIACDNRGPHNITHVVKITIVSKSGTHETSAQVLNIWTGHQDTVGIGEGKGGKSAY
jgi:hypothetical protein